MEQFDSAAFFLLDMGWPNLFEQVGSNTFTFRCKGCGGIITGAEREKHHKHHKLIETRRRERGIQKAKVQAAKAARQAKALRLKECV